MSECVICPHKPKPTEGESLACFDCSNRVLRHLRELEEYLPTLSLLRGNQGMGEYSPPVFESKSPANDAVIVHTDPRSGYDDGYGAVAVIASWSTLAAEERGFTVDRYALGQIAQLRANHSWITAQSWVDEYAGELRQVHSAVRALACDPVPKSVGRCISIDKRGDECGGKVFELDDASGVRCSKCRRTYSGLDLDRLRVANEREAS